MLTKILYTLHKKKFIYIKNLKLYSNIVFFDIGNSI